MASAAPPKNRFRALLAKLGIKMLVPSAKARSSRTPSTAPMIGSSSAVVAEGTAPNRRLHTLMRDVDKPLLTIILSDDAPPAPLLPHPASPANRFLMMPHSARAAQYLKTTSSSGGGAPSTTTTTTTNTAAVPHLVTSDGGSSTTTGKQCQLVVAPEDVSLLVPHTPAEIKTLITSHSSHQGKTTSLAAPPAAGPAVVRTTNAGSKAKEQPTPGTNLLTASKGSDQDGLQTKQGPATPAKVVPSKAANVYVEAGWMII